MAYNYRYIENLKQFNVTHFTLKLTDSDNILPELSIPIILNDNECNQENLDKIANDLITSNATYTINNSIVDQQDNTSEFNQVI